MSKMTKETKNKLSKIPRRECSVCHTKKSYTNPMAKCFECQQWFCYDHINGLQYNNKMKKNEPIRDVCFECTKKFNYKTL